MVNVRNICATLAVLLLFVIDSDAAFAVSHIVELEPASGEGGSSQIAICKDDVDCLMAVKVLSPTIGSSIILADIAFTSKNVKIRFSVNGIRLYSPGFGHEKEVVDIPFDGSPKFGVAIQLFALPDEPRRAIGDSLVIHSRPDYVARLEIRIAPANHNDD